MPQDPEPAEQAAAEAIASVEAGESDIPKGFEKVSDLKRTRLLIALSTTPILDAACRAAGITPRTLWNWRHDGNAEFLAAYEIAREMGIHVAEAEAWKRATDGTVEDVYGSLGQNQGTGVVGQRRVKSDTMLIFMLKGAAPEKYRERTDTRVSGKDGGPIEIAQLTTEELIARHKELIDIAPPEE
jgi:hypothetical protein